jgi:EAL domain-containing protein (putative c-di-GMP-specific phosphodiesterase class I)
LRWHHPQHGQVSPELVIERAEKIGLIGALTDAVIDQALAQAARWHGQGLPLHLSVNLSMHNLHDSKLANKIDAALRAHGVPGNALTLEMTESAMMSNPRLVMQVLNGLDALGIRIAVDDFGTGFSSLAYLTSLPVDILKIDKSFVIGLVEDKSDQAIVQATLSLGHNLGLEVVAEGVESREVSGPRPEPGAVQHDPGQGGHGERRLAGAARGAAAHRRQVAGRRCFRGGGDGEPAGGGPGAGGRELQQAAAGDIDCGALHGAHRPSSSGRRAGRPGRRPQRERRRA